MSLGMTETKSSRAAYQQLTERFRRQHHLRHLQAMAQWDAATMMPAGGNLARAEALAELDVLMHQLLMAEDMPTLFDTVDPEQLNIWEAANLQEMYRSWQHTHVLPEDLVRAKRLAGSTCEHAWRDQRHANDWTGFAKNLKKVVELSRQEATLRAEATRLSPYDSMLDLHEPGMTGVVLDQLFADLKTWLPDLIQEIASRQVNDVYCVPEGPFSVVQQEKLGRTLMDMLGFDFHSGRLDVSTHPFCGGVPQDVRITTRYAEDDFTKGLMGVIHETGHARYEQNLPQLWLTQPVGKARSMGIHESQSLFFEMQISRHPAFLERIAPAVQQHLGKSSVTELANLQMIYSRVKPGLIRVDADEVTYPAHIILRYEIERALIEGQLEVDDIPDAWNEKMKAYLGLDTLGDFCNGPMQDIHWTDGAFGYFPSYTLGAMYAAQQYAAMEREISDLEQRLILGDMSPVFEWLNHNIWSQASCFDTDTLITQATGEPLNPAHFKAHLMRRYLG